MSLTVVAFHKVQLQLKKSCLSYIVYIIVPRFLHTWVRRLVTYTLDEHLRRIALSCVHYIYITNKPFRSTMHNKRPYPSSPSRSSVYRPLGKYNLVRNSFTRYQYVRVDIRVCMAHGYLFEFVIDWIALWIEALHVTGCNGRQ